MVGKRETALLMLASLGGFGVWWAVDVLALVSGVFRDSLGELIEPPPSFQNTARSGLLAVTIAVLAQQWLRHGAWNALASPTPKAQAAPPQPSFSEVYQGYAARLGIANLGLDREGRFRLWYSRPGNDLEGRWSQSGDQTLLHPTGLPTLTLEPGTPRLLTLPNGVRLEFSKVGWNQPGPE